MNYEKEKNARGGEEKKKGEGMMNRGGKGSEIGWVFLMPGSGAKIGLLCDGLNSSWGKGKKIEGKRVEGRGKREE
ncbi:MAG: hypothetical protein U5N53_22175 [Mycobacterium sp.]|nr:hypothetical protein [Mycobacterium sp.]